MNHRIRERFGLEGNLNNFVPTKDHFNLSCIYIFYIEPVLQYLNSPRETINFTSPGFYHEQVPVEEFFPEIQVDLFPGKETSGRTLVGQSRPNLRQFPHS